jgi:hypothetical protein
MDPVKNQLDFGLAADDLLEFPRDLGEEGWFQFLNEQKAAYQRIEDKFHVVLNRKVRLRLRGEMVDHVGKLVLDSLELPAPNAEEIELRIGRVAFVNTDIDEIEIL